MNEISGSDGDGGSVNSNKSSSIRNQMKWYLFRLIWININRCMWVCVPFKGTNDQKLNYWSFFEKNGAWMYSTEHLSSNNSMQSYKNNSDNNCGNINSHQNTKSKKLWLFNVNVHNIKFTDNVFFFHSFILIAITNID